MSIDMSTDDFLSNDSTVTIESNVAAALVTAIDKLALNNTMGPTIFKGNDSAQHQIWSEGEPIVHKVIWNIVFYKDPAGDKITTMISDLSDKELKISQIMTALENNTEGILPYLTYCLYARRILNEPWLLIPMAHARTLIHPGEFEIVLSILDTDIRRMSIREAATNPFAIDLRRNPHDNQTTLRVNVKLYGHLDFYSDNPKGTFPTISDLDKILAAFAAMFLNPEKELSEIIAPTREPPTFSDPYDIILQQKEEEKEQPAPWAPGNRRRATQEATPDRDRRPRLRTLMDSRPEQNWVPPAKRVSRR